MRGVKWGGLIVGGEENTGKLSVVELTLTRYLWMDVPLCNLARAARISVTPTVPLVGPWGSTGVENNKPPPAAAAALLAACC